MAKQTFSREFLIETLGIKPENAIEVCGSCEKPVTAEMLDARGRLLPHVRNDGNGDCLYGEGHNPCYIPVTREDVEKVRKYNGRLSPIIP